MLPAGFLPAPPKNLARAGAMTCWSVLILRDLFVALIFIGESWRFVQPFGTFGDVAWWAALPVAGALAAGTALYALLLRSRGMLGLVAAVVAAACAVVPGFVIIGPGGIALGVAGLALTLRARTRFPAPDAEHY